MDDGHTVVSSDALNPIVEERGDFIAESMMVFGMKDVVVVPILPTWLLGRAIRVSWIHGADSTPNC